MSGKICISKTYIVICVFIKWYCCFPGIIFVFRLMPVTPICQLWIRISIWFFFLHIFCCYYKIHFSRTEVSVLDPDCRCSVSLIIAGVIYIFIIISHFYCWNCCINCHYIGSISCRSIFLCIFIRRIVHIIGWTICIVNTYFIISICLHNNFTGCCIVLFINRPIWKLSNCSIAIFYSFIWWDGTIPNLTSVFFYSYDYIICIKVCFCCFNSRFYCTVIDKTGFLICCFLIFSCNLLCCITLDLCF